MLQHFKIIRYVKSYSINYVYIYKTIIIIIKTPENKRCFFFFFLFKPEATQRGETTEFRGEKHPSYFSVLRTLPCKSVLSHTKI